MDILFSLIGYTVEYIYTVIYRITRFISNVGLVFSSLIPIMFSLCETQSKLEE
jgi:uncharacterized membrane protein